MPHDVIMADRGNLMIRLDAGGGKTATTILRNLRNPANPTGVLEIVEAADMILQYPVKRVEMTLMIEYVTT